MKETKIKIISGYGIKKFIGKMYIAELSNIYATIKYSVNNEGFQKKTKYEGRVIPNEFFIEV